MKFKLLNYIEEVVFYGRLRERCKETENFDLQRCLIHRIWYFRGSIVIFFKSKIKLLPNTRINFFPELFLKLVLK